MITVFLVDDHDLVRQGLVELLNADPELDVVGEADTVAAAMARIPAVQPDVAVLDVRFPDGNGIDLCRDLLAAVPQLRCLILTSFTDERSMIDAILAGASGYVAKDIRGDEIAAAVKAVGAGKSLLDNRAAQVLMDRLRKEAEQTVLLRDLSATERAMLALLGEGLTNREIGQRMFLAEKTVKNYVSRILSKLGLSGRTEAALLGAELVRRPRV
ncbi:MAG: response regulator transcription factor [Mycobacterium sp.]